MAIRENGHLRTNSHLRMAARPTAPAPGAAGAPTNGATLRGPGGAEDRGE
jgi:hypothetical protein